MSFPTTGLLDDFNRGSLGANWTNDPWGFGVPGTFGITSNQLTISGGVAYAAWNVATYGPDCEAYITIATKPPDNGPIEIMCRMGAPDGAATHADGYGFQMYPVSGGTDIFALFRWDNGSRTNLSGNLFQEVTSGDKFGISAVGSTITGWYNGGSGWTTITTQTDATYGAAGYLSVYGEVPGPAFDDFSGGTVVDTGLAWIRA